MAFGKLLDKKIKEKNMSQSSVAKAAGIPATTLSSMISRDNTKVEIEVFLKLCDILDCDPEEFFNEFKLSPSKELPPSFAMKYNNLDDHGKKLVTMVLDAEYERCKSEYMSDTIADNETTTMRIVANDGSRDTVVVDNDKAEKALERLKKSQCID